MFKRVLVLAAHTDDGEWGCGGSLARFNEEGAEVFYVAYSIARESVPEGFPEDILATEAKKATRVLGIPSENLIVRDYPVRHLPEYRQEILDDLIVLRKEIGPDLVFLPSQNDIHQDHQVIAMEGLRAFKGGKVLGWELPWNNMDFEARSFVKLEERHVQKKMDAINCYESQKHRGRQDEEFIRGWARMRGVQALGQYAEAFEVLRWVMD